MYSQVFEPTIQQILIWRSYENKWLLKGQRRWRSQFDTRSYFSLYLFNWKQETLRRNIPSNREGILIVDLCFCTDGGPANYPTIVLQKVRPWFTRPDFQTNVLWVAMPVQWIWPKTQLMLKTGTALEDDWESIFKWTKNGKQYDCCEDKSQRLEFPSVVPGLPHSVNTLDCLWKITTSFLVQGKTGLWSQTAAFLIYLHQSLVPLLLLSLRRSLCPSSHLIICTMHLFEEVCRKVGYGPERWGEGNYDILMVSLFCCLGLFCLELKFCIF